MTVSYSPRSQRDLAKIRDFIAAEAGNRQVADNYIARLLDACDALAILPERYALCAVPLCARLADDAIWKLSCVFSGL